MPLGKPDTIPELSKQEATASKPLTPKAGERLSLSLPFSESPKAGVSAVPESPKAGVRTRATLSPAAQHTEEVPRNLSSALVVLDETKSAAKVALPA